MPGPVLALLLAAMLLPGGDSFARTTTLTVTTQLSSSTATTGDAVTDTATLVGAASSAGGTVTYSVYTTADCSGTAVFAGTVNVTNGVVPTSAPWTATPAGVYQWQALYKPYPKKTGTLSACGTETLTVTNRPTISTQLSKTSVLVGESVSDQATLAGATSDAGGTVTYSVFPTGDCSGSPVFTNTVQVTGGSVPASSGFAAGSAGKYQWQAAYSGDAKNQTVTSVCGSEPLQVGTTAVTTQLSSSSVTTGMSVTDQATLSGVTADAGGTVTYNVYATSDCSGSAVFTSTVPVTGTAVQPSAPFTANPAGSYQWQASYSGDAQNAPAESTCGSEPLTVKNLPSVTTQLSSSSVKKDDVVTDAATLAGATADAGGTVTYNVYLTGDCSGSPVFTSTVAVTNGSVPSSAPFTADPVGTYQWLAAYSGDAKNSAASTSCGSEPLTVNADPMIPLIDMGTSTTYYGFQGGLYENGSNDPPADHASVGIAQANKVTPLAADGTPSANGKIVLISMGASSQSQEWCGFADNCSTAPLNPSFMTFAAANTSVNHSTLVIVNCAQSGDDIPTWGDPTTTRSYGVCLNRLTAAGVTEAQVEVVWFKDAGHVGQDGSLPASNANAYRLETGLGQALRAIKIRYPNVRQVFVSSRIYGGYVTDTVNRLGEPWSYETGFSYKWLIQAQINEMRTGIIDATAGDLNYNTVAPWIAWAAYLWANGTTPRSDGLVWLRDDFNTDGEHPNGHGRAKVANLLLNFFLTSKFTQCWFTTSGTPCS